MPRKRPTAKVTMNAPLSSEHLRFAQEYTLDLDPEASALRAGISDPTVGHALLGRKTIQVAIQTIIQARGRRTEIYADEVLRRWWLLATADAREFTQVQRVNCRRCWGRSHQYQFRDHELIEAEVQHERSQLKVNSADRVEFNDLGGGGFDGYADPCRGPRAAQRLLRMGVDVEPTADHDCPACDGLGEVTVWVNDSRHYSPAGAILFDGVKISKDGSVEVRLRDREHAEDMVAQHLGMLVNRTVNLELDPTKLSDDQLDSVLKQFGHLAQREDGPLLEHSPEGEAAEA